MKNTGGKLGGFVVGGLIGFLAIVVLSRLHPEEDFAGITIATIVLSGLLFAFIGGQLQSRLAKGKR